MKIADVGCGNIDEYGFFCVKNKKHPGYTGKKEWLDKRFAEGLFIKMAMDEGGKPAGFIECIPGEKSWRGIYAEGWLVIHCLWVNSKNTGIKGLASRLIEEAYKVAVDSGMNGLAVVTSDGSWMAGKEIFVKNGFELADSAEPAYQLMVKQAKPGELPYFPKNWETRLAGYDELTLLYTNQCPYIGKAVNELPPVAEKYGVKLNLVEMNDPEQAREIIPSPYGVFSLIYKGKLLSAHMISATRFGNILRNDLGLKEAK